MFVTCMRFLTIISFVLFYSKASLANEACDALKPTNAQDVEESFKGKIQGQIEGWVSKLAGAAANLEGEYKKLSKDVLKDYDQNDKLYILQRVLYLVCIEPNGNIDANRLLELFISGTARSKPARYSAEISVDRYKDALGRGWDYPLQQPDPYLCLSGMKNPSESFCVDHNSPDWRCSNKWVCKMVILTPRSLGKRFTVTAFDKDADKDDLIGQNVCNVGEDCVLQNNKANWNSATVKLYAEE